MKIKASLVVMSHLSDAQEMLSHSNLIWGNDHINFAKYVILRHRDLNKEIDPDLLWNEFTNSKFFSGSTFKHPELKEGEEFLVNVRDDEKWETLKKYFKSLRYGTVAYVTNGSEIVTDRKPLFGIPK
jgi:hypothetical protein